MSLVKEPHLLREEILGLTGDQLKEPIILDEVQKIPQLLDEVHWLHENRDVHFAGFLRGELKQFFDADLFFFVVGDLDADGVFAGDGGYDSDGACA